MKEKLETSRKLNRKKKQTLKHFQHKFENFRAKMKKILLGSKH